MQINLSIDSYDVKSLEQIFKIEKELTQKSELLNMYGNIMKGKLIGASNEFTSVNYERVEFAINNYLKKMELIRMQLKQLNKSCVAFAEKLGMIWE